MAILRRLARGRDEATPARALGAVFTVVLAAVALVGTTALLIYFFV
ncbi:MAG: hypothetical protein ICV67_04865 [Thermoleophilia bacterium]|nr:hypothetical protein [Thermoleophilia bacterium]